MNILELGSGQGGTGVKRSIRKKREVPKLDAIESTVESSYSTADAMDALGTDDVTLPGDEDILSEGAALSDAELSESPAVASFEPYINLAQNETICEEFWNLVDSWECLQNSTNFTDGIWCHEAVYPIYCFNSSWYNGTWWPPILYFLDKGSNHPTNNSLCSLLTDTAITCSGSIAEGLQLTGSGSGIGSNIDLSLPEFVDLQSLTITGFTDGIPASIGSLTNLQYLVIAESRLTAPPDSWLFQLKELVHFEFKYNKIGVLAVQGIQDIDTQDSAVIGSGVPLTSQLVELSHLQYLSLEGDYFIGSIPSEFGELTGLEYLYLDNNDLSGEVPRSLCTDHLKVLTLYNNSGLTCLPACLEIPVQYPFDWSHQKLSLCTAAPTVAPTRVGGGFGLVRKRVRGPISPIRIPDLEGEDESTLDLGEDSQDAETWTSDVAVQDADTDDFQALLDIWSVDTDAASALSVVVGESSEFQSAAPSGVPTGVPTAVPTSHPHPENLPTYSGSNPTGVPSLMPSLPPISPVAAPTGGNAFPSPAPINIPTTAPVEDLCSLLQSNVAGCTGSLSKGIVLTGAGSGSGSGKDLDLSPYTALQSLTLTGFTQGIPSSLGSLTNLQYLVIADSTTTSALFTLLFQLLSLIHLELKYTTITVGTVLESDIDTQDSQVTGSGVSIPSQLVELSHLQYLSLEGDHFIGSIPSEFGELTGLEYLYLDNNDLSGEVPASLCLLNLVNFTVYNNSGLICLPACLKTSIQYPPDWSHEILSLCTDAPSAAPVSNSSAGSGGGSSGVQPALKNGPDRLPLRARQRRKRQRRPPSLPNPDPDDKDSLSEEDIDLEDLTLLESDPELEDLEAEEQDQLNVWELGAGIVLSDPTSVLSDYVSAAPTGVPSGVPSSAPLRVTGSNTPTALTYSTPTGLPSLKLSPIPTRATPTKPCDFLASPGILCSGTVTDGLVLSGSGSNDGSEIDFSSSIFANLISLTITGFYGIPSSIGLLTNLQYLVIEDSTVIAPPDSWLFQLKELVHFEFKYNKIGALVVQGIQDIDIQDSQVIGSGVPLTSQLVELSHLQYLSLEGDYFIGSIPSEFGELTGLEYLYLDNNDLSGE
eukprot:gene3185-3932_t